MNILPPTDFYMIRNQLTEEERQVQEMVARFVDENILPIISEAFDKHHFPQELVKEIGELYAARRDSRMADLAPPRQLGDYVGFLRQADTIQNAFTAGYADPVPRGIFRQWSVFLRREDGWDFGGRQTNGMTGLSATGAFRNNWRRKKPGKWVVSKKWPSLSSQAPKAEAV